MNSSMFELLDSVNELMEGIGGSALLPSSSSIKALISCVAAVILAFGVFQCFFGYKLFRITTAITGFFTGGLIGAFLLFIMTWESVGAAAGFLLFGILGAFLAYKLYLLAVFITCCFNTFLLVTILGLLGGAGFGAAIYGVILGLIVGIIGCFLAKPVIVISTAVSGGTTAGFVLGLLLENTTVGTVLGVVLAVLGIVVQLFVHTGDPQQKPKRPARKYRGEDFLSGSALIGILVGALVAVFFGFMSMLPYLQYNNDSGFKVLISAVFSSVLLLVIGAVAITALALLIGWVRSRNGSVEFKGIRFSSVQDFIGSVREVLEVQLTDLTVFKVIFVVAVLYFVGIWAVFGLWIGAAMHHDSRCPVGAVDAAAALENPVSAPRMESRPQTSAAPTYSTQNTQNVLVKTSAAMWMPGLPIVVTRADIVKASQNSAEVSLKAAFQNLGSQPVIAVYFSARCSNLLQQELQPLEKQSVQDFALNPGAVWTIQQAIPLPDSDTRRVELVIHNVVMADGSVCLRSRSSCRLISRLS